MTPAITTSIATPPALEIRSPNRRSAAVDFFRGLGLLMVYIDHVFPNVWHSLTLQGIGLSDFAEIFVFLSGYVNAAIYGRVLDSGSFRVALPKLFRKTASRMLKLYGAHLVTLAACFSLVALFATNGVFVDQRVTNLFWHDPPKYAFRALLLLYAPFAHSVLPLYIVFVPFIPLIVAGLRRFPGATLIISAVIWFLARKTEFTLPQQLTGEAWVFNPFAWQFMLVAGCALRIYQKSPFVLKILRRPFPLLAAIAVLVVFALKLLALFNPAFLPLHHFSRLADILQENYGKSVLISYRIAYFFCLLLLAVVFLKKHHHWLSSRWAVAVIRCGRHSLTVFCASVVLATLASLVLAATHGGASLQLAATLGGVAILLGLARFKELGAPARRTTGLLPVSSKTYMPAD